MYCDTCPSPLIRSSSPFSHGVSHVSPCVPYVPCIRYLTDIGSLSEAARVVPVQKTLQGRCGFVSLVWSLSTSKYRRKELCGVQSHDSGWVNLLLSTSVLSASATDRGDRRSVGQCSVFFYILVSRLHSSRLCLMPWRSLKVKPTVW